jgi:hypothetical protein
VLDLLLVCWLVGASLGSLPQHARPVIDQPEAPVRYEVIAPEAARATQSGAVSGAATWYRWHPGEAAAGPALRQALGKGWRGESVRVCHASKCIVVTLTDWCLCSKGNRVIDLDVRAFASLAPTSRGVIPVSVNPLSQ